MPLHKTPAITLRSRRWGEADRIVTFYTLRLGKLTGVARGARRMKSRFGGALEPLVHCDLNLFEKAGDSLFRITQADIRESFPELREDLGLMAGAAQMVNLASAVTVDGDPDQLLFEILLHGLRGLRGHHDPALAALLYQIRLLGQAGFRPQMDHCALCGTSAGADQERFSSQAGGTLCAACADRQVGFCFLISRGCKELFRQSLRLAPAALPRLRASGQVRRELQAVVESFVRVVAGRRLPSVEFLAAEHQAPRYGSTPLT